MELTFDLSNEIIDLSQMDFSNDGTWLTKCSSVSNIDLNKWLYEEDPIEDYSFINSHSIKEYLRSELQNNIDSRTFTRPKRRSMRPSIEKYNKELYETDYQPTSPTLSPSKKLTDSGIQSNESPDSDTPPKAPIFDLTQSIQSHYFENMLTEMPNSMDTFQNMSPPSLVNSMCSSTFTNLMESSFIKNDPVLREIRDTDYTQSILQQETEPMFQSMTESFSSLNSDVPENFLRKVAFDDTFKKSFKHTNVGNETVYFDATFVKDLDEASLEDQTFYDVFSPKENKSCGKPILNGTYQRSPKLRTTFNVSDVNNGTIKVNKTFQKAQEKEDSPTNNSTLVISQNSNSSLSSQDQDVNATLILKSVNNTPTKRLLSRRESPSVDLNRVNYIGDENNPSEFKRNSLTGSTDSAENLDYMSVSSGSTRSLHKTSSTEGIEREFFLGPQSTPKVDNNPLRKIFENTFSHQMSPVEVGDRNSDPELSSSNENFAARPKPINTGTITKQKSLGNIGVLMNREAPMRPVSKLETMRNNMRGSYPNLKTATLPKPTTKKTNLNSMGRALKGSYTSLKPMCANLPVAPPLEQEAIRVAQPQLIKPRTSGLPRPMSAATGIPRPMSSRIPAPRSARCISKPR